MSSPSDVAETVSSSIVSLWKSDSTNPGSYRPIGTGFFVTDDGLIATANHILEGDRSNVLAYYKDSYRSIERRIEPPFSVGEMCYDMQLVRLKDFDERVPWIQLNPDYKPRIGCPVASIGYAYGGEGYNWVNDVDSVPFLFAGVISAVVTMPQKQNERIPDKIFVDMSGYGGLSGAPLFEPDKGAVVGMVKAGKEWNYPTYRSDGTKIQGNIVPVPTGLCEAQSIIPIYEYLKVNNRMVAQQVGKG